MTIKDIKNTDFGFKTFSQEEIIKHINEANRKIMLEVMNKHGIA